MILKPSSATVTQTLGTVFDSSGIEAFLVGGAVRDALLERAPVDIDISVDGDALAAGQAVAARLGGRVVFLDEAKGLARVVPSKDREAGFSIIEISSMPEGGITADLERRDFTIDAIAMPLGLPERPVIDLFGGRADLDAGLIRALSPSVFQADPARLIRAPRLAAQLGFAIAEETAGQIRRDAHLVAATAQERVRDELMKLMVEPGASVWLRLLDDLEILCRVIPELAEAKGVTQPKEHYWDVFLHQIETAGQVEQITGRDPSPSNPVAEAAPRFDGIDGYFSEPISDGHSRLALLKFAALLHDVAKPATKTIESSGRIRFLGHHKKGAAAAEKVMRRLRFSNRATELVRLMVENHLRPGQMASPRGPATDRAIFRYFRDLDGAAIDTLYLNLADYLAARGPLLDIDDWSGHCRFVGHILREGLEGKAPESLPKLISGHDIMEAFSLNPGQQIGALLAHVTEAQAEGAVSTRDEALALVRANLDHGTS